MAQPPGLPSQHTQQVLLVLLSLLAVSVPPTRAQTEVPGTLVKLTPDRGPYCWNTNGGTIYGAYSTNRAGNYTSEYPTTSCSSVWIVADGKTDTCYVSAHQQYNTEAL